MWVGLLIYQHLLGRWLQRYFPRTRCRLRSFYVTPNLGASHVEPMVIEVYVAPPKCDQLRGSETRPEGELDQVPFLALQLIKDSSDLVL